MPFNLCNSDTGCVPDNFDHTYCYSGTVDSNFRTAITESMSNLDAQSSYFDTFIASCNSLTDAQWQQTTAPGGGVRGDHLCRAKNSANECERARLRLNARAAYRRRESPKDSVSRAWPLRRPYSRRHDRLYA